MYPFLRCCLFCLLCYIPAAVMAETRFALVIGIGSYDSARDLPNPVADATAVADQLRTLGFAVTTETDRDARRLRRALEDFAEDAKGAELALVYYAGHGIELGGENRLLPSDVALGSLEELEASSLPLSEIVEVLRRIAPAAILLVDACRNDPFSGTALAGLEHRGAVPLEGGTAPALSAGFGRIGRADGLIYAFATAPGATAEDGHGGNSPFVKAILRHLGTQGLELRGALTLIQQDVYDRTRGRQLPYVESALPDLVFVADAPGEAEALPERDRLLIAMAGLSPATRAAVERVAAAEDMPLAPLYAALLVAKGQEQDGLDKVLTDAARQYRVFQDQAAGLSDADPAVAALREEAARLMELGVYREAQAKLQAAFELQEERATEAEADLLATRLSQAETLRLSARAAEAALDYPTSLARWNEIVLFLERLEGLGLPEQAQLDQTNALWWQGYLLIRLGDFAAAQPIYEDWNRRARLRAAAAPDSKELQHDLANSLHELGTLLHRRGQLDPARQMLTEAQGIWRSLSDAEPENARCLRFLGTTYTALGDIAVTRDEMALAQTLFSEQIGIFTDLLERDPQNPQLRNDLSVGYQRLGSVLAQTRNLREAEASYQKALDLRRVLLAEQPEVLLWQENLAAIGAEMARLQLDLGDVAAARTHATASLDLRRRLAATDPENLHRQGALVDSLRLLARVHERMGEYADAITLYDEAQIIVEMLIAKDGNLPNWQNQKKIILDERGVAQQRLGNLQAAEAEFRAAMEIAVSLVEGNPDAPYLRHNLARSYLYLGQVMLEQGRYFKAHQAFLSAVTTLEPLTTAEHGGRSQWRNTLAEAYIGLADGLQAIGSYANAIDLYHGALALRLELSQADPADAGLRSDLALSYSRLGEGMEAAGDLSGAEAAYRAGIDLRRALVEQDPLHWNKSANLAVTTNRLCQLLRQQDELEAAVPFCREALELRRKLAARAPQDRLARSDLAAAVGRLGFLLRLKGQFPESAALFREQVGLRRDGVAAEPKDTVAQNDLAWALRNLAEVMLDMSAPPEEIFAVTLNELEVWLRLESQLVATEYGAVESMATIDFVYEVIYRQQLPSVEEARLERAFMRDLLDLLLGLQGAGELTEEWTPLIGQLQDALENSVIIEVE